MQTTSRVVCGSSTSMPFLPDCSVDLVVTSPPYPMVSMWDEAFSAQSSEVRDALLSGGRDGRRAFLAMHGVLSGTWEEVARVLKPGGIACINIGDATRSIDGNFQLFSNHTMVLDFFLFLGFMALPGILWRKPTNAPNKFMGSGMLPVGAYVTHEHEHILILRKGERKKFRPEERTLRRESAFFWEERNTWFSDIWLDVKGVSQSLLEPDLRSCSAAFPLELAYRLVSMYSVKGDLVLDPFSGTGTTLAAAMTAGRNSVGVEIDRDFVSLSRRRLLGYQDDANKYMAERLRSHVTWVQWRTDQRDYLRYVNKYYLFPVMTYQEEEIYLNFIRGISATDDGVSVEYAEITPSETAWKG